MNIHDNIKPAGGYETAYVSPTLEKDNRTYVRIGQKADGTELYKRVEFDDAGQGKIKEELIEIKTINP